jgi:hypothetical protein
MDERGPALCLTIVPWKEGRVLRGRRFEASYVPMVRRHARSGRRWRRDYLLAHLTCSIFGKAIETSSRQTTEYCLLLRIFNQA